MLSPMLPIDTSIFGFFYGAHAHIQVKWQLLQRLQQPPDSHELAASPQFTGGNCLQALCFMAGANSIFDGDKLLTTKNNERNADLEMFEELGLKSRPAFVPYPAGASSSDGSAVNTPVTTQHLVSAEMATGASVAAVQQ